MSLIIATKPLRCGSRDMTLISVTYVDTCGDRLETRLLRARKLYVSL